MYWTRVIKSHVTPLIAWYRYGKDIYICLILIKVISSGINYFSPFLEQKADSSTKKKRHLLKWYNGRLNIWLLLHFFKGI